MEEVISVGLWEASRPPDLGDDDVHVWHVLRDKVDPGLANSLSDDERRRARGFHFDRDRERYVRTRGALRGILGGHLGTEPARVDLRYGFRGKPALASDSLLSFNVTHSDGLALVAVAWGRELGIDLERTRSVADTARIAERFFSAAERSYLGGLAAERQPRAFYEIWTRKEAVLKAEGHGLALSLDSFDVCDAEGRWRDAICSKTWSLQAVDPGSDFAAALAAEGPRPHVVHGEFSGA